MSADIDLARLADVLRTLDTTAEVDVALELAETGVLIVATVPGGKDPLLTQAHIDGTRTDRTTGEITRTGPPCLACKRHDLIPARDHGATTDAATIRRYWTAHPDAGVGMKNHPRLVRGDGDFADGAELRKARKLIGYGQPDGVPEPFTADTPGGQYRRRFLHWIGVDAVAPGGGTPVLGIYWYGDSGYVLVKGRHPNGRQYMAFRGSKITELPETVAANLRRRTRNGNGTPAGIVGDADVATFLDRWTGTEHLERLAHRRRRLANAKPGDRHPLAIGMLTGTFREAIAGHYPARLAHDTIRDALHAAGWEQHRFDTEWADLVSWAVARVANLNPDTAQAELTRETHERIVDQYDDGYDAAYIDSIDAEAPRDLTIDEIDALTTVGPDDVAAADDDDVELIDWHTIANGAGQKEAIVEGLLIPGRWTAGAAGPKIGKSTLTIHAGVGVSQGVDPFDGTPMTPKPVLYLDGEMGRLDMWERLTDLGHTASTLEQFRYTDVVPKLDTLEGTRRMLRTVDRLGVALVIIDGVNGCVAGEENDSGTWRALYDLFIAPLKRRGISVYSNDNLGKDKALGPRGSSVKLDKADAVIQLTRTDNGIKLTTTHRRTAAYPLEVNLTMEGRDGSTPINYRRAEGSWPAGTNEVAHLLDRLAVPVEASNVKARQALREAGERRSNETVAAAVRWRRAEQKRNPFR